MAGGVVHIQWYATILRGDLLADAVAEASQISLRYGATRYSVHRSRDDMYKITQMTWFESKGDWYRFWEGPEMTEFRRRYSGKYQIPISYVWQDEIAAGELGPQVALEGASTAPEPPPVPEPEPEPTAA
jgi:hypothetical protein